MINEWNEIVTDNELDSALPLSNKDADMRPYVTQVMSSNTTMSSAEIAKAAKAQIETVLSTLKCLRDAGALIEENGRYRLLARNELG